MKKEARKKQKRKEKSKKCTILLRKITLLPTQKVGGATSPAHPLGVRTLTLPIQKVERERPYFKGFELRQSVKSKVLGLES